MIALALASASLTAFSGGQALASTHAAPSIYARLLKTPLAGVPQGWRQLARTRLSGPYLSLIKLAVHSRSATASITGGVGILLESRESLQTIGFLIAPTNAAASAFVAAWQIEGANAGGSWTPIGKSVGLSISTSAWSFKNGGWATAIGDSGRLVILVSPGFTPGSTRASRSAAAKSAAALLRFGVVQAQHSHVPA